MSDLRKWQSELGRLVAIAKLLSEDGRHIPEDVLDRVFDAIEKVQLEIGYIENMPHQVEKFRSLFN